MCGRQYQLSVRPEPGPGSDSPPRLGQEPGPDSRTLQTQGQAPARSATLRKPGQGPARAATQAPPVPAQLSAAWPPPRPSRLQPLPRKAPSRSRRLHRPGARRPALLPVESRPASLSPHVSVIRREPAQPIQAREAVQESFCQGSGSRHPLQGASRQSASGDNISEFRGDLAGVQPRCSSPPSQQKPSESQGRIGGARSKQCRRQHVEPRRGVSHCQLKSQRPRPHTLRVGKSTRSAGRLICPALETAPVVTAGWREGKWPCLNPAAAPG